MATIRGRRLARPAPVDLPGGLEAVELRHLHVHQHHVVGLSLDGVDGLEPVGRHVGPVPHLPEEPERDLLVDHVVLGQEDAERVAGGQVRIELPPRHAALGHVDRLLGQDRDQRVEELGRLDGLVEIRGEALLLGPRLAAPERGEEDEGQRGSRRVPPERPRQRHAVHLRHVHVQDAEVEALVRLDPARALRSVSRWPAACIPQASRCVVTMRRLVALSSTTRTCLSRSDGWTPLRSRRAGSGPSATAPGS